MEKTIVKRETGRRLRKLREALGYTQERMAEVLDVSVTLYKKMESEVIIYQLKHFVS